MTATAIATGATGALDIGRAQWIWAGMTRGDSGELDPLLAAGRWSGHHGRVIDGDVLVCFRGCPPDSDLMGFALGENMLEEFLALTAEDPAAIVAFSRRYGSLRTHDPWDAVTGGFSSRFVAVEETDWLEHREPVADWLALVDHFDAVLAVAAAAHDNNKRLTDDEIERLRQWPRRRLAALASDDRLASTVLTQLAGMYRAPADAPYRMSTQEVALFVLNSWQLLAPSTVRMEWDEDAQAQQMLAPSSMVAALVLKLTLAAARKHSAAACSECGRFYIPKRKAREDQNNYCKACGTRAAWRRAQRKRRGQA